MRARTLTETINRPNIAVIVEQYKCQDHTVLNKIGAQAQHHTWRIRAVGTGQIPEVELEQTSISSAVSPAKSPSPESPTQCAPHEATAQHPLPPPPLPESTAQYHPPVESTDQYHPSTESPAQYPTTSGAESPTAPPGKHLGVSPAESPADPAAAPLVDPPIGEPSAAFPAPAVLRAVSSAVSVEAVVDKGVAGVKGAVLGTQVCIRADGKQVHPERGHRGKLWDDFRHEWNFRATASGIGMVSPTEKWIPGTLPTDVANESGVAHAVQDAILGESSMKSIYEVEVNGKRLPAVLKQQRADGCFDVVVFQPDENGIIQQMRYPSLDRSRIFVAGTETAVEVPECLVAFTMPRSNVYGMTLTANDVPFTTLLGRVSPRLGSEALRIFMDVPRAPKKLVKMAKSVGPMMGVESLKEEMISVNVGAAVLRDFLSGEVRIGGCVATRLSKCWKVHLGPFAEHTVSIEKKSRLGSILTLTVDNDILAECSGEDLGSSPGMWQCKFRFVGDRHIDFNVFETTKDGVQLDSKGVVTKSDSYEHVVEVMYEHRARDDLATAQLTIDGVPVHQLPVKGAEHDEPSLHISRDVLAKQYGVQVPEKIVRQDTRSTARKLAGRVWQDLEQKNGPLDQVLAQKAGETGAFFSRIVSDVQQYFHATKVAPPSEPCTSATATTRASPLPSLLTGHPSKIASL